MVFNKNKFLEMGGIKPNIKLTFGYEFFLRMTYNSINIMSIPRLGYKHTNMREGRESLIIDGKAQCVVTLSA